jgi:hypothetical protein
MPYRVYEASEIEALVSREGAGADDPRPTRMQDALNRLEDDGYALVAVDGTGEGGALYVFRRTDVEVDPDTLGT